MAVCDKHNRLVVYAAYDANENVDMADVYYLEALQEVADTIIYVADNKLNPATYEKLQKHTTHILAEPHGEYDFGSYKRGFFYAKEKGLLEGIDEVVFCNDSCYAPICPFAPVFEKMREKSCDFWSLTENYEFARHLQSFFLVFRPKVFQSDVFQKFLENIVAQKYVQAVIQKYEIGLSTLLFENGFIGESYIPYPSYEDCPQLKGRVQNTTQFPLWLMAKGCPVLKKKAMYDPVANKDGFVKTRWAVLCHNIKLCRVLPPVYQLYMAELLKFKRFFYQKKITHSGKLVIKICKIPVYSKEVSSQ